MRTTSAAGFGAVDKLSSAGDTATGTITFAAGTVTASPPVLAPTFTAGIPSQLADQTQDYVVYLTTGTSGVFTLAIGPTFTPANVLYSSVTVTSAETITFRVPAGWFVLYSGTATLTHQTAVGC